MCLIVLNPFILMADQDCPSLDKLYKNRQWIEYNSPWDKNLSRLLLIHLDTPLAITNGSVYLNHVDVEVDRGMGVYSWREIIWVVKRTEQEKCHVKGSVAYYAEITNINGWPPRILFTEKPYHEKSWLKNGSIGLIEFRWYDPVGGKRHRWFNLELALFLQWVARGEFSPIRLPKVINSLD